MTHLSVRCFFALVLSVGALQCTNARSGGASPNEGAAPAPSANGPTAGPSGSGPASSAAGGATIHFAMKGVH